MTTRGEQLFSKLHDPAEIRALIGQSEDVQFDCKEWPSKDDDAQRVFAKAACGLTNAEGGVLVIGMRAKSVAKDQPDLVDSVVPVSDTRAVKSRVLDLIGQLVEPGIEDVRAVEVNESKGSSSGFVIVHIPVSERFPRRSRKDWKFYLRIGSGTFPMEYFQIADMFGERPQPNLELELEEDTFGFTPTDQKTLRQFLWLTLSNVGRGIAKFPSIRFKIADHGFSVYEFGVDGNFNHGLPMRPSETGSRVFRGGVDDVIYPMSSLKVTKLHRPGRFDIQTGQVVFDQLNFSAEIACEGIASRIITRIIPEARRA